MLWEQRWSESPAAVEVQYFERLLRGLPSSSPASPDAATTFPSPLRQSGKAGPAIWDRNPQCGESAPAAPRRSRESQILAAGAALPASRARRTPACPAQGAASAAAIA